MWRGVDRAGPFFELNFFTFLNSSPEANVVAVLM